MSILRLPSFAKINLYLAVRGLRKDDFHSIETVFERINLYDTIVLNPRSDNVVRIICDNPDVPRGETNLACRGARILQKRHCPQRGVDIRIVKRIPVGAGLGGGSSNAAAVLAGLNKLWKLNLPLCKLIAYGRSLGSDVPFFLHDTSFARGCGRGDRITALPAPKAPLWHFLAVPRLHVSTPHIYKAWDTHEGLTRPPSSAKLLSFLKDKKKHLSIGDHIFNSLENVTAALYPQVGEGKQLLFELGARAVVMSGSGPSLFAPAPARRDAVSLAAKFKSRMPLWRTFVVKTV